MLAKMRNEELKDVIMLGRSRSFSGATGKTDSAAEANNGHSNVSH